MKKLNKVLILGVAGACAFTGGFFLTGCNKNTPPAPITVTTEQGVVLSRWQQDNSWTVSQFLEDALTIVIPDVYDNM